MGYIVLSLRVIFWDISSKKYGIYWARGMGYIGQEVWDILGKTVGYIEEKLLDILCKNYGYIWRKLWQILWDLLSKTIGYI